MLNIINLKLFYFNWKKVSNERFLKIFDLRISMYLQIFECSQYNLIYLDQCMSITRFWICIFVRATQLLWPEKMNFCISSYKVFKKRNKLWRVFHYRWVKLEMIEPIQTNRCYQKIHCRKSNVKVLENAKGDIVIQRKDTQRLLSVKSLSLWAIYFCAFVDKMHTGLWFINEGQHLLIVPTSIDFPNLISRFYAFIKMKFFIRAIFLSHITFACN